jgi:cell division protein FtsB
MAYLEQHTMALYYKKQFKKATKEIEKLKTENSKLKSKIEKLTDRVHTGFGGNS